MPHAIKIAVFSTIVAALAGLSDEASARGRLYPFTSLRAGSCLSLPDPWLLRPGTLPV